MSGLPRNATLEHMLIDVLRSTPVESPQRHEAWQVYADWLLGLGEPVGEWLAASLRADEGGAATAPVRAALHEFELASRFRLVDLDLADLSEVPELARIADLTWERGFITSAAVHCRKFRAFDSELLEHTPDRLLDVVLRSPCAAMLHRLELDVHRFAAKGSRVADFSSLLAALPEDLPLRSLALGDADSSIQLGAASFVHLQQLRELSVWAKELELLRPLALPELAQLSVRVEPAEGSKPDRLAPLCDGSGLPALRELSLELAFDMDELILALLDSPLWDRLTALRIGYVSEVGAAVICRNSQRLGKLARFEVVAVAVPDSLVAALRRLGCSVSLVRGLG